MPLPVEDRKYNDQDDLQWPDDCRVELIGGIVYDMTPSPSFNHQSIVMNLFRQLDSALRGHPCTLIIAPMDEPGKRNAPMRIIRSCRFPLAYEYLSLYHSFSNKFAG